MIIEQRTYVFHPGGVPKFIAFYDQSVRDLQASILGNLIGYFTTEIGMLNQTVHMWGYDSFEERQRRRAELMKQPLFQAFVANIQPLLVSQESKILNPLPFSPIR